MALKLALILTTRNKVVHTVAAVRSMFAQVGPPIEIILSDSGSVDGTVALLDDLAASYSGPHKVRRLNCPCAQAPGMGGMNAHVNWVTQQTDADILMQLSGDDYDLPERALRTREAFEAHKPSMVLCSQFYVSENMEYQGETPHAHEDRWCTMEDMTINLIGGSTVQAWDREFWDKVVNPLGGIASMDVVMPPLAVMDRGAWLVAQRLHAYRKIHSINNTGLEGVYNCFSETDPRRAQLAELMHFQVASGWQEVIAKMDKAGLRKDAYVAPLYNAFVDRTMSWTITRLQMTREGIPPIPFKV